MNLPDDEPKLTTLSLITPVLVAGNKSAAPKRIPQFVEAKYGLVP